MSLAVCELNICERSSLNLKKEKMPWNDPYWMSQPILWACQINFHLERTFSRCIFEEELWYLQTHYTVMITVMLEIRIIIKMPVDYQKNERQ